MTSAFTPLWTRLVDDAAIFPPGDAPLHDATAAFTARRDSWAADLVGSFVLRDTDLPLVRGFGGPLAVVVTGGAGQVAGPISLAARLGLQVTGLEIALRDLDDLPGNVRRVVAAVDAVRNSTGEEVAVHIELPATPPSAGWLAAADEVAAAEFALKFRTGGPSPEDLPDAATLAHWIDASLDRETPFKCTAGLHRAVRHEVDSGWQHGFLNVLLATAAAWDGADRRTVEGVLAETNADVLLGTVKELGDDLARARRWFTSFGSCSIDEPLDDLVSLGLVTQP